ncbi:response regulator [bacterium]|nr:response regulator [bacterium]
MDKIRTLLVDDEIELITTMVERLEYRGVEADFAVSGADALEKMKYAEFDVVVVDLKMPGMSGPDIIRAILKNYPKIPILLMTGQGMSLEGEDIPKGIVGYLPKPVNLEELITKMREAIKANG